MKLCNILTFDFQRHECKTRAVPTPRTNSQKLITLHVDAALFDAVEQCRGRVSRSQWLRDAILEKLKSQGIELPEEVALAPDRSGKGGPRPKPKVYQMPVAKVAEDEVPPQGEREDVKYPKGTQRKTN